MTNKKLNPIEKDMLEREIREEISKMQMERDTLIKRVHSIEENKEAWAFNLFMTKIHTIEDYISRLEEIKY